MSQITERRRQLSRRVDQPEPGHYLIRLVRKGPLIPARIVCANGMWWVTINGVSTGAPNADPFQVKDLDRACLGLRISEATYLEKLALKDIPGHPNATPKKPIDLNALPPIKS